MGEKREKIDGLFFDLVDKVLLRRPLPNSYLWRWRARGGGGGSGGVIYGDVVWLCGCVVVWLCGCVVVWLCGCVVVWLCVVELGCFVWRFLARSCPV